MQPLLPPRFHMTKKLSNVQYILVVAIHEAASEINENGFVPCDIAYALCRHVFNPHLDPFKILGEIERCDHLVLCRRHDGHYVAGRCPSQKEVYPSRTKIEPVSQKTILEIVKAHAKPESPTVAIPQAHAPILNLVKSPGKTTGINAATEHHRRRVEILRLLHEIQENSGTISKNDARVACEQIEPNADADVIITRMVTRGWLEEEMGSWRIAQQGDDVIRSANMA